MNANIKENIMDTARELFNEKGFHDTCMRDIASELHISVGNLTYHFKKKEDLIEAIALRDHQDYRKPAPFQKLSDLYQLLQKVTDQKSSRPYYYRHYVQLAQICPAIYEMQLSVLNDLHDVLTLSFRNFMDNGLLKKEFSKEYPGMIKMIMTLMVHGLPDLYRQHAKEQSLISCAFSAIVPCLTVQGYEEYLSLSQNHML